MSLPRLARATTFVPRQLPPESSACLKLYRLPVGGCPWSGYFVWYRSFRPMGAVVLNYRCMYTEVDELATILNGIRMDATAVD